ncbi:hypothetical protein CANARDRAFT_202407 [[Candida] arabinofermentans NRRL YB-2248]|uniref:Translation initiation factor IF-2, mitochondrial n=1 Tax=[Candida] arabinofermentans NRRL YB-2248 TaxID=983967 RepID=A0A1E4SW40_9ASCO|nr:hypothetical protein CANARDRAFT_202407 [[Candida] arabinofermentans NRRL YB-2248]
MIKQESKPKIDIPSFITVANFSTILRVRVPSLLQNLAELGFENMTNDYILDFETAHLIADEYGFEVNQDDDLGLDLFPSSDNKNALPRAPIVTIMGHVDHGKTTILDYLRKSSIVKGEHGGITQHIGAFSVKTPISKKNITFLDTPGHAAFLKMRERGANITDVVVLVVAAEDSVMPQTIEAIKHSKKAGVPVVVAINKCDKEEANPDKVVADLSAHGIDVEDYGGEIPTVKISAKTGMGMDDLEETIVTVSDMLELKSPITKVPVEGYILESEIKKGLGKVATFLVKRGQLKPGTILVSGTTWAKVKVMRDEHGKPLKVAGPATPVEVSGWKEIPDAGEYTIQADSEAIAKKVIRNREKRYRLLEEASHIQEINKRRIEQAEKAERDQKIQSHQQLGFTLEEIREMEPELFEHEKSQVTTVPFIIKADVSGSAEAVAQSIEGLGNHEVNSRVLFHAVGTPTESDIERAKMAGATILAFNLKVPQELKNTAALAGVEIKEFNVIYHLIENVLEVLTEKLPRRVETKVVSKVQVRQIFEISKGKKTFRIAGSKVIEGVFKKNATVRLTRETNSDYVPYTGRISQLKIEKDDVTEVKNGVECGIELAGDPDLLPGDILEAIEEVEVKRHL